MLNHPPAGDEARWRRFCAATRTRAPKHAAGMFLSLCSCPFQASARLDKKNTILTDGVSFCDCPQVLLPVRTPVYRKERNVCKGNLSRVSLACLIARPQATTFAEQKCCSKKKDTPTGVFLFGAGDEARTRYLDLGKVALYQMSYARTAMVIIRHEATIVNSFFHSFRIISTIPQLSVSG